MSNKIKFYTTDVFGMEKYTGNQLATFMNCGSLSGEEMQKMTREINFSESTFILSDQPRNGGYDVRIFTPGSEVDFAGHPTLGTAYIIAKHIIKEPTDQVILNLKVGQIPVTFPGDGSTLWMQQKSPVFSDTYDVNVMAGVLGLNPEEFDAGFPIQAVSTGLPHIIVPLKSMDVLKRVRVNRDKYFQLCETSPAKAILTFCPGGYTPDQAVGVRQFVEYYGVPEDPATGSGNGCLAGYLVKYRYFNDASIDILSGQGYEIDRPSQLFLKAWEEEQEIKVSVGGKVISIAEGMWG